MVNKLQLICIAQGYQNSGIATYGSIAARGNRQLRIGVSFKAIQYNVIAAQVGNVFKEIALSNRQSTSQLTLDNLAAFDN